MQIYFHSRLWSYLPRVPILAEGTVYIICIYVYVCVCVCVYSLYIQKFRFSSICFEN